MKCSSMLLESDLLESVRKVHALMALYSGDHLVWR